MEIDLIYIVLKKMIGFVTFAVARVMPFVPTKSIACVHVHVMTPGKRLYD
jgi:hypothetical protein